VAPGRYTVRLVAKGQTLTSPFVVRGDPRLATTPAEYAAQLALALAVQAKTNEVSDAAKRILELERALDDRVAAAKGQSYEKRVGDAAKPIHSMLESVRDSLVEIHMHADEMSLHYPIRYYNMLLSLAGMVQSADAGPTAQEGAMLQDLHPKIDNQLGRLRTLESTDIASFNALLKELNVPAIPGPPPAIIP